MATQWQIGDRIQDRWQIYHILKGGMGTVYIVYDHEAHAPFAAKTFQERFFASQQVRDRFIQEAHTWINLDIHQHIVRARFVEVIGGRPFLFLEYVTGGDLSRWIGTPRLTLERALRFAVQFCYGMEHALFKGVKAHRDIKPANVLLTEDGTLKVTDFGLAKVFDKPSLSEEADEGVVGEGSGLFGWLRRREKTTVPEAEKPSGGMRLSLTRTGMGAGTAKYMAPEQFEDVKRVDVRADVYSFGVMLYEMVTGELPFRGQSWVEYERLHRVQAPPSLRGRLPKVAEGLEAIVQRCLRKEAGERYEDFGVLRGELVALYEGFTDESAPVPVTGKALDAADWYNKGGSLNRLGRPGEALACYDRALEIDQQFIMAWSNKGAALADLGQPDEALACFDRALEIDPQLKEAWYNKGAALGRLGRLGEALACYDRALEIDQQYAMAWSNKGVALADLGQPEEALACFNRSLAIDPQFEEAWFNKGSALDELGQPGEALACYDRALAIDPQLEETWNSKGIATGALGRYDEEIACYDRALAIDPQYVKAWYNKGSALVNLGRLEEALACYDRALEIDQQFKETWNSKGNALDGLGRLEEALACYDRALEIDQQYAMAWCNKGNALDELGRPGEALACYDHALAIDPQYVKAWDNKGNALVNLGRPDKALACYDRTLAIDPQYARAWYNKGAALGRLGRLQEALSCFQRAQRLGYAPAAQGIAACLQALGR